MTLLTLVFRCCPERCCVAYELPLPSVGPLRGCSQAPCAPGLPDLRVDIQARGLAERLAHRARRQTQNMQTVRLLPCGGNQCRIPLHGRPAKQHGSQVRHVRFVQALFDGEVLEAQSRG